MESLIDNTRLAWLVAHKCAAIVERHHGHDELEHGRRGCIAAAAKDIREEFFLTTEDFSSNPLDRPVLATATVFEWAALLAAITAIVDHSEDEKFRRSQVFALLVDWEERLARMICRVEPAPAPASQIQ